METDFDNEELSELLHALRDAYGYDFTNYAISSLKRRIQHYCKRRNVESMSVLKEQLVGDEYTFEEFVQQLSVTVTELFRDPSFYRCLTEKVITRLASYPFIKIWIAGCATGEEVYSIAILLQEHSLLDRTVIYATDINQKSLAIARAGIYSVNDMQTYTKNYMNAGGKKSLSEYYLAKYNSVLFDKALRKNVVFAPHNLAVDKSFNEFQLILCRNVLIYFNQQLQNKVLQLFYDSLCTFGFLALGNKESLLFSGQQMYFEELEKKEKIYRKIK